VKNPVFTVIASGTKRSEATSEPSNLYSLDIKTSLYQVVKTQITKLTDSHSERNLMEGSNLRATGSPQTVIANGAQRSEATSTTKEKTNTPKSDRRLPSLRGEGRGAKQSQPPRKKPTRPKAIASNRHCERSAA
jgi:hypothetical protein